MFVAKYQTIKLVFNLNIVSFAVSYADRLCKGANCHSNLALLADYLTDVAICYANGNSLNTVSLNAGDVDSVFVVNELFDDIGYKLYHDSLA